MKTKTNRRTLTKLLTLGLLGIAGAGLFNAPSASALPLTDLPSVGDWSNSIFNPSIPHIDYNTTDGETVDSDLGAIVLEILDEDGKAVPGAVFEIDGVRAHRTMKSYVYDKDFGMYSQFTTDDNGKVVIRDVPYGTYTVHFVGSPDGSTVTETTKTVEVNEETATTQSCNYRKITHFSEEITDGVFVSPSGSTYWDVWGSLFQSGGGIPFTWDESANGYTSEELSGLSVVKKNNNTFTIVAGNERYDLKRITGNLFSKTFLATEEPEMRGQIFVVQENPDGTITATLLRKEYTLSQDASGCYPISEDISQQFKTICKQSGIYALSYDVESEDYEAYIPMRYDEKANRYVFNDPVTSYELIESGDGRALLFVGFTVQKDSDLDVWAVFNSGVDVVSPDEFVIEEFPATLVSFKATAPPPSDSEQPDEAQPVNPQTSDILTKATCIILITTASAFVITRKLSRR